MPSGGGPGGMGGRGGTLGGGGEGGSGGEGGGGSACAICCTEKVSICAAATVVRVRGEEGEHCANCSRGALTKECASAQSGLASHADLHCTSMGRVSSEASRLRNMEPLAKIMPDPTGMPWQTALAPLTPFR